MELLTLANLIGCKLSGGAGAVVAGITEDSRRVQPGFVFVAAPGARSDGHAYAEQAVAHGAVAVLGDRAGVESLHGVPYLHSACPRAALGVAAHALAGDPSRSMTVIGITGTNGKSSSVTMVRQVLVSAGLPAAVLGTLGYVIGGVHETAPHTTPFGEDLAGLFARALAAGERHVVMEVSSHSLEQERVAGIDFDVAAFTNLTQDHLDYHVDMDSYRRAKLRLFERIEGPGRFTVANVDDPSGPVFARASQAPCHTFGREGDCRAEEVRHGIDRTWFVAHTPWGTQEFNMALLGNHNVSNALCVIAICGGLGVSLERVAAGVAALERVPGRFERVDAGQDFQVVVDYAHTDDGLKNVLSAAREICRNRVIVVFGCGGDRDRTKRPKMGAVAARMADYVIVTSDNPRTEEPQRILEEIEPGVVAGGKVRGRDYVVEADRAAAIGMAVDMAAVGDLVLIAGKGHEDYQILGTRRIHFDDREVALAALNKRLERPQAG